MNPNFTPTFSMNRLQAGYFIPAFDEVIEEIAGADYTQAVSQMDSGFQITGLPLRYDPESVHPLTKVLWNILTRGSRLKAGIRLTHYILDSQIGNSHFGVYYSGKEVSFRIEKAPFEGLNQLNLKYILKNIGKYTGDKVVQEFGPDYASLFNVIFDLRSAAHLQRVILHCLMMNEHEIHIDGVSDFLVAEVAGEINDWITCLNRLLDEGEEPMEPVRIVDEDKGLNIYYTYDPDTAMTICTALNYDDSGDIESGRKLISDRMVTGEAISYADLHTEEHREAIKFMLENVFREQEVTEDLLKMISKLSGREDLITVLPQGVDMKRAWQIACLLQPSITMVVEPDAARMKAPCEELGGLGMDRVCCIPQTATGGFVEKRISEMRKGKYQLLMVHPDLLLTETFSSALHAGTEALMSDEEEVLKFSKVILNDIHRVSEWGNDFRSDYLNAARKLCEWSHSEENHVALKGLTDQASYDILNDIYRELSIPEGSVYAAGGAKAKSGCKEDTGHCYSSFTSVKKEKRIIRELLTEIRYDHHFFLDMLALAARREFPLVAGLKLGKNRYLYAHGPLKKIKSEQIIIGLLDLEHPDLRNHDKVRKNFDQSRAISIMNRIRQLVKEHCDSDDYAGWVRSRKGPGIGARLHAAGDEPQELTIGLNNDLATEITKKVSGAGNTGFEQHMVMAAATQSSDGEEFINELNKSYALSQTEEENGEVQSLSLSAELEEELKEAYYELRTARDTQLALYRMKTVGIVEEYEIDHSTGSVQITFVRKPVKEYYLCLQKYIRQYFGRKSTAKWIELARSRDQEHFLIGIVDTLIEFADEEIARRREKATGQAAEALDLEAIGSPGRVLSLFEGPDYLPGDLNAANKPVADMVEKYLSFISSPPDKSQSEMSTVRQLRDACRRIREDHPEDNPGLDMLTAFSMFAVDVDTGKLNGDTQKRAVAEEAMSLYMKSVEGMQNKEDWGGINQIMKQVNEQIMDINPVSAPLVKPMMTAILLQRTNKRLKEFLERTGISS